jgi:hypothetical protein
VIERDDDHVPMPRTAVLPKPTHPPATDGHPDIDELVPF